MLLTTITPEEAATTYKDAPRTRMDVGNITQAFKEAVSRALISAPGITYVVEPVRPLRKTITETAVIEVEDTAFDNILQSLREQIKKTDINIKTTVCKGIPGTENIAYAPMKHTLTYRIGSDTYFTYEDAYDAMQKNLANGHIHNSEAYISPCILNDKGEICSNGIVFACVFDRYEVTVTYERNIEIDDLVIIYSH